MTHGKIKNSPTWRAAAVTVIAVILLSALFMRGMDWVGTLAVMWSDSDSYDADISAAANKHGLPPALVKALILRESRFNPRARGKHGEIGLMQLIPPDKPGAAAEWARIHKSPVPSEKKLFDVTTNLDIGCWYLAAAYRKWRKYRCQTELALAEYNAGAARTAKWKPETPDGEVMPRINIKSTAAYVKFVMEHYRRYQQQQNFSAEQPK